MAWTHAQKKRAKKKAAKVIFGKSLPIVLLILALLFFGGKYLYENNDSFSGFVDGLGIFSTKAPVIPPIDPNGDEMAVYFIDVGQGDSTLFQTPQGSVLVDCGEKEYGVEVVEYLKSQGIEELEYFIITHPDSDHMGCAAHVLENITVKNFVMNGQQKSTQFFQKAMDVLEEKKINSTIVAPGDVITVGALQMKIYGPQQHLVDSEEWNEASLIIHATYGNRSFLLTGDAEKEGESDLLKYYKDYIKCDVFSAGHHGSKTSNSRELLAAARPTYVVISCGEGNDYGHPHQEALDSFESVGATVYRTDELGSIMFITDGNTLTKK